MKILVAGGAGYVGSALVPKLLELGYRCDVLDRLWFGNHLPAGTKVIEGDVIDADESLLRGYDQVIFLAGLSNDPMAAFAPSQNFVSNAAAPAYLAYAAKCSGVRRFIYAGSCSVYGYAVDELYGEEAPTTCEYPYGISKLQGEAACLHLVDEGFSVLSLRKGTVCGFSPRMRLDLVVNTMFKTALTQGRIIVNNPAIWRPILAIQDAVDAYIRAVEVDHAVSGIFNVASANYTVGEIGGAVKRSVEATRGISIDLETRQEPDIRNYRVDGSKAARILGFEPGYTVDGIVDDLFTNLRMFEDFENPAYYNIETFRRVLEEAGS